MCDWCGAPADHDRPYVFGDVRAMRARLGKRELQKLMFLKQNVFDARHGYPSPAADDIRPDPVEGDQDAA